MNTLAIRPWRESDLTNLVQFANNSAIAKNMTDAFPHPFTEENGKKFIAFANAEDPIRIFAITQNDLAIGGIGIHPQTDIHKRNAELGYWLGEAFWGKGIISFAIGKIVKVAFENYDIDRVFARPFGTNIASQKALEKNGFILEARLSNTIIKNGVLLDECIYAIRKQNLIK